MEIVEDYQFQERNRSRLGKYDELLDGRCRRKEFRAGGAKSFVNYIRVFASRKQHSASVDMYDATGNVTTDLDLATVVFVQLTPLTEEQITAGRARAAKAAKTRAAKAAKRVTEAQAAKPEPSEEQQSETEAARSRVRGARKR